MNAERATVLALGLCALAGSWPAGALDLIGAYRLAEKNDPTFESSRYSHEAARTRVTQARAGLLPELRVSGRSDRADGDVSFDQTPAVNRRIRSHDLRLELTQPLVRVQNWAGYSQARLLVVQSEGQFAQARQDLILRVAQAYFDVLMADDNLNVTESQKRAVDAQLELVTRGRRAGNATVTDVHEAQSRVSLTLAQAIAARNELEVRRSLLEQIIGQSAPSLSSLRTEARLPSPSPATLKVWMQAARDQHPAVLAVMQVLKLPSVK